MNIVFAAYKVSAAHREEGPALIGLFSTQDKANTAARESMEGEMVEWGEGATVSLAKVCQQGYQEWEMLLDGIVREEAYTVVIPVQ